MFTVAFIGPDGAGKSTITQQIVQKFPLPVKYLYMGVNLETSNLVLPTTRLALEIKRARGGRPDISGPPDKTKEKTLPKNAIKRTLYRLKFNLRMMNLIAEEWFRQIVVWYYLRKGFIVIFDRHFFTDYYAHDISGNGSKRPLISRLHGFMLNRLYPKPNLVICLDAPAEVLFKRKGEGTLELLENRRQEYLQLRNVLAHFIIVDASQPEEMVVEQVIDVIWDFFNSENDSVIKVDWKKWAS
jgi:thymidylate kinase